MTDPNSGGYSSADEPTARRLPLRTQSRSTDQPAGNDPWTGNAGTADRTEENPFSGTALGSLPDNSKGSVNPFDRPAAGSPSDLDDEPVVQRRARTSFPVVLGLICSLIAGSAALTAWLAPAVVAVGALGVLLSLIGMFTARKPHVGGRLVALLAILIGLAAIGLGLADHFGTFSWLNHDLPHHARNWLNDHVPGLN